ncbi:MAG: semialdehyde dehydrogenase family protein [Bacteroidetes bacterium]|nr:MAG: semialdehyde dehydrogenase family protein [Bacteroidota bacterium]
MHMMKKALIFGATGLIGNYLVDLLLADARYSEVVVFARRKLDKKHPKLQQHIVDFMDPDAFGLMVEGDELFCCLGTTIRTAGSQDAFRKVDYDLPVWLADMAKINGIKAMLVVSSLGADKSSRNFYLRTKGEMEEKVAAAGIPKTVFARPSMLLGPRAESRTGEFIGKIFMRTFAFLIPARYKAIHAETVARALIVAANDEKVNGVLESEILRKMTN